MGTETEIKRLLTPAEHAIVQKSLNHVAVLLHVKDQKNHYFDTADQQLRAQKAMLRLRQEGKKITATLKYKSSLEKGISRATELEQRVETLPTGEFSPTELKLESWFTGKGPLAQVGAHAQLARVGSMLNTRRTYGTKPPILPEELHLELDHTVYDDGTVRDELECETDDPHAVAKLLDAWLKSLGVAVVPATETKYAQFLRLHDE